MCNSPATFQAMMDGTFEDIVEGGFVLIYMDDILIFAQSKEHLEQLTKQVLQRLWESDLYLKPKKCEFNKEHIEYLGMVIQEGKITMDSVKVKGLQDWLIPSTVKQL